MLSWPMGHGGHRGEGVSESTGLGFWVESGPGDKGLRGAYMANLAAMVDMAKTLPYQLLFIPR